MSRLKLRTERAPAAETIAALIASGQEVLQGMTSGYFFGKRSASFDINAFIVEWQVRYSNWYCETQEALKEIFPTAVEVVRFQNAPPSPVVQADCHVAWCGLKNTIEAKLAVLDGLFSSLNNYDETPGVTGSTFHLTGANSRVNINSHDSSSNVAMSAPEEVFAELRRLVQAHAGDSTRQTQILAVVQEMEEAKGTRRFLDTYTRFTGVVADHIQVYAPLLPFLAEWVRAALS